MSQGEYQLGHDPAELDRLNEQGGLLAPATTMLLQAAGIRPGMRVLDLGSGSGDHAFAVASLVGPDGSVAGVEQSPEAVSMARARAERLGLANVTFTVGDIHDPAGGGPFDAVTGRLVLMYVPDPVAVLRAQAGVLRPGGLVAPVEFDVSTARTLPAVSLAVQAKGLDNRDVPAGRHRAVAGRPALAGAVRRGGQARGHAGCAAALRPG